jgi:hypothetical protein
VDDSGTYIHGYYEWQCDFDPSDNYYYLDNYGGFFGRYDPDTGNIIYVKNVGNGPIYSLDKHGSDLYVSGDFYGIVDADPNEGTHFIGRDGFRNAIVGKYDLLDGNFQWARAIPTTGFIGARKIIADQSGATVSGYFAGSADFSTSPKEENRTSARIDAFVARYTKVGSLDWAKGIGTPGYAVSIAATLTDDGYFLGGLFGDIVNFDPYQGNVIKASAGDEDVFIAKYSIEAKAEKHFSKEDLNPDAFGEGRTIALFPNPVETTVFVGWTGFELNAPVEVSIINLFGETIMTRTVTAEEHLLDLSSLPDGYYFLRASQDYLSCTQRFMKKH